MMDTYPISQPSTANSASSTHIFPPTSPLLLPSTPRGPKNSTTVSSTTSARYQMNHFHPNRKPNYLASLLLRPCCLIFTDQCPTRQGDLRQGRVPVEIGEFETVPSMGKGKGDERWEKTC
ncbi:hypothetical protein K469DRAFT_702674 [Zopfia rhizophila CBS 207.26]|uniref:Uncharacterized protein n=1 Tax=Zopfia rhizophila CBS 207.26 TaxID=1314779 RepID=A0A6A6ECR5_9PEZI|nr:hypothetical protein K469DRAFT_702674 [Zopfia rhizophila CBS 207.26]